MKRLLLILAVLYTANAAAQSVKLERNEQDPYTKTYVKETNYTIMCDNMSKVLSVKGRSHEGRPQLMMRIVMGDVFSISPGEEAIVLLKNGETVHLKCIGGGGTADFSKQTYGSTRWKLEPIYAIDPSDLNKLTTQAVKGVRVYFGSEYYNFDKIKEKNATDIQEVLKAVI